MLNIYSCAFWPPVCLLWRNVYLGILPHLLFFFFNILIFMRCLYILDINLLLVASFANIFSHSMGVLLMVSFAVQKLLSLIRFDLFLLLFLLPLETDLRKYCYNLYQRIFCLCSLLVLWCHV